MNNVYFVTGIDTNIGKSYATGWLAKRFAEKGLHVITQKMVQTGCTDISEDIVLHRKIQGIDIQQIDKEGVTCAYLFSYPCSPHLAAKMENRTIDINVIARNTKKLLSQYDIVVIEGAGGLLVPVDEQCTTADYLVAEQLPVVLVTSGKLGSINHTLLSLEVCRHRNIKVTMLIYNTYFDEDPIIIPETKNYLQNYLANYHQECEWIELPSLSDI